MNEKSKSIFSKSLRIFLWSAPFILLFLLIVYMMFNDQVNKDESPIIGSKFENVDISLLRDEKKTFSFPEGEYFAVNFWASWCLPCRDEFPLLLEIKEMGLIDIYGISSSDTRENAIDFLKEAGNPFVKTGFDTDGDISVGWGVYAIPETFLVDDKGIVFHLHSGQLKRRHIKALREAIEKRKMEKPDTKQPGN